MRWKHALLANVAIIIVPVSADAQDATTEPVNADNQAADAPAVSGDIVVTAQRREQRLQDVPISVTAVTGEEIAARNVSNLNEMQYAVPGLSTFDYGPGLEYVQLRGVSNSLGAPTVGIYLDETPVTGDTQGAALDIRLLDLERVEVLRGPQATLYGEGSMGGTIRYITANPSLNRVSGTAEAEYSWTEDGDPNYQFNAAVGVPLVTDKLGIRLVAGYEKIGGYVDNVVTGKNDVNDATIKTLRGKLLARPSENLTISLLGLHQEVDQDNQNFGVKRKTSSVLPRFNRDDYDLGQAVVEYDFGGAALTATASYFDRKNVSQYDLSPFYVPFLTALPPFGFGLPDGFITTVALPGDSRTKVFNSEVRLASRRSDRFNWLFGAVYRDIKGNVTSITETAPGALPFDILNVTQSRRSRSYAAFGEISYAITPQLTALAGLRYFEDHKRQESNSVSFGFGSVDNGKDTFKTVNPRFNLMYEFSRDSMVYTNVAKGFRSGGFNLTSAGGGVVTIPPTYDPDQIWTYEIGTKHQLFNRRLSLDADVYYSDWKDVQSSIFAPGSAITIVSNSGRVKGWGVDFSAAARPVDGMTLTATYGWNNLEYKKAVADKIKGDPVDNAVQKSYSASFDYRRPIFSNTNGFFRADYQHAGKSQITLRNFGNQIIKRPSRDLFNVRAGLDFERFEVSAFANNIFDEDAPNILGPFGVLLENLEQRPRVIGLNAKAKF